MLLHVLLRQREPLERQVGTASHDDVAVVHSSIRMTHDPTGAFITGARHSHTASEHVVSGRDAQDHFAVNTGSRETEL